MNFSFKVIDKESFIRIWNSDFEDGFSDSHKTSFEDTPLEIWKPIYQKHVKCMYEVELDGSFIGHFFII